MGKFHLTNCSFIDLFSVLHPRHKLQYFKNAGWEDNWIKTACIIDHDEFDQTYAFMDVDSEADADLMNKVREQPLCKLTTYYFNMILGFVSTI